MQAQTLLAIRRRIRSVKSTQQITKAMQMISGVRLRKVERRTMALRPYARELDRITVNLLAALELEESPLTTPHPEIKRICVVVMGGDRGLCGAFNTNIIRYTEDLIQRLGKPVILFPMGRKMINHFRKAGAEIVASAEELFRSATITLCASIADRLKDLYLANTVDQVVVVYVRFVNVLRHIIDHRMLLPISVETIRKEIEEELGKEVEVARVEAYPSPQSVADYALGRYISLTLYRMLLETLTSEMAARMSAMQQATENAQEMVDHLTLIYNQARQRSITRELLDIVGTSEALKAI